MKYLSFLIKPASSSCNLACSYCFYRDVSKRRTTGSYGIMTEDVMKSLIDQAFTAIDHDGFLTFAFQGGEPTLAGLEYFRSFIKYVNSKKTGQSVYYSIQTNGTTMNEDWALFFKENHFLVGVSLDGYKSNHDHFRQDGTKSGTFDKIMMNIDLLKKFKVDFNILTVLTNRLAGHADAFYEFLKSEEFSYVQCIPCLGELTGEGGYQLTAENYFKFYSRLYYLWYNDYVNGQYTSVTLFDNLLLMLTDRPPQQCGMMGLCTAQLVVEANGNVYPCDFYVLDQYYCGNLVTDSLDQIIYSEPMQNFLREKRILPPVCDTCPFFKICRGGCKRQNVVYLSKNECAHQKLLSYLYPSMSMIAKTL